MNVLSLFDGISGAQVALLRSPLKVTNYFASEVNKHAIKVTQQNFPDTVQLGDITQWKTWDLPTIDLLIGGSPCQGFSFAGKQLNFNDPRSKLFFEFLNCLNHFKPKYFLLENVRMKQEYRQVITDLLKVDPTQINSALVSAQNRQRLYWCNWRTKQPTDRGILLRHIIDPPIHSETVLIQQKGRGNNPGGLRAMDGKTPCLSSSSWEHNNHLVIQVNPSKESGGKQPYMQNRVYDSRGKAPALTSFCNRLNVKTPLSYVRKLTPIECERLQTFEDGYTEGISNSQRYKALGNSFTVDVITHLLTNLFYQENPHLNLLYRLM